MSAGKVAVIGSGQTVYSSRSEFTYPELVEQATSAALAQAELTIDDIDAVVFALAPDALIGVNHGERWCVDAIGAQGKPFMRVNTGGSTGMSAFLAGYFHVASGLFRRVLVAGADRVGESGDSQQILNKMWDKNYERSLPLNAINMLSLQATRYMHRYDVTEEQTSLVSVHAHKNGMNNPLNQIRVEVSIEDVMNSRPICWPIKLYDASPASTGGCAVLLAAEAEAKSGPLPPVWVRAVSHVADTYYIGDRMGPAAVSDYADCDAQAESTRRAYRIAGITNPRKQFDVAELYYPFSCVGLHMVEAVGLAEKGKAHNLFEEGVFDMNGEIPVNPSGGLLCAHPIAVTGLVRIAEAALQLQGRAGQHQVPGAKTAITTGIGGTHEFYGTVILGVSP